MLVEENRDVRMRKTVIALLVVMVNGMSSGSSFAAGGHGPAGCGLGTEVIFRDANQWYEHVLASLINFTASQTLAMVSGTLGCEDANGPLKEDVALFFDRNLDQLARDFAVGEGESLATLSELIGIQEQDQSAFNLAMRNNFDLIISSEETSSGQAYMALIEVMREHKTLASYLG